MDRKTIQPSVRCQSDQSILLSLPQSPPEISYTNETMIPAASTKKTQPTQSGKKPVSVYFPRPTTPAGSTVLADYEVVSEHDHFGVVDGSFISLLATGSDVLR